MTSLRRKGSTNEAPLHDYIDMEAYDVVPGPKYRELVGQLEASRAALRTISQHPRARPEWIRDVARAALDPNPTTGLLAAQEALWDEIDTVLEVYATGGYDDEDQLFVEIEKILKAARASFPASEPLTERDETVARPNPDARVVAHDSRSASGAHQDSERS